MPSLFLLTILQYATTILPWFLLGSILAFIIERHLPSKKILMSLGSFNCVQIICATILGMLSPLSIMSFLPVAQSLVKKGVHPSLMYSFLMSERSYDLQSFFIIASFFGVRMAFLSTLVIFASLLVATVSIKDDEITFHVKKKTKSRSFMFRQAKLFLIVGMGIIISAATKTFISPSLFYTYTQSLSGGILTALSFGFLFYLGPVISNYPVAKTFADLGMSGGGVFSYITISPILSGAIFIMFTSIAGRKITAKFIGVYTITGFILTCIFVPVLK